MTTNQDFIEQSLGYSEHLSFHTTDNYDKSPPVIILGFMDARNGAVGYNALLDAFENGDTTLALFRRRLAKLLDISIINKKTGDAVNIKNLKFNGNQFDDFLSKEPKDRQIVLVIGNVSVQGNHIFQTREPFYPLVVDRYEITNLP